MRADSGRAVQRAEACERPRSSEQAERPLWPLLPLLAHSHSPAPHSFYRTLSSTPIHSAMQQQAWNAQISDVSYSSSHTPHSARARSRASPLHGARWNGRDCSSRFLLHLFCCLILA